MSSPKLRKATGRKKKQRAAEKEMAQKISMFDRMPEECLLCEKPFDKRDKDMVMSWIVVVREEEDKVNLWCPECWTNAQTILHDFAERIEENEVLTE